MIKGKLPIQTPSLQQTNTTSTSKLAWLGLFTISFASFIVSYQIINQEYDNYVYLEHDDDNVKTGGDDDWIDNDPINYYDYDDNDDTGEEDEKEEEDDEYFEETTSELSMDPNAKDGKKMSKIEAQTKTSIPTLDVQEATRKLQYKIQSLEQMDPIPFYMYDHPNITLANIKLSVNNNKAFRIGSEALNDLATIHALNSSSWKTSNPNDAKLFIIPIPMGRIAISNDQEYYEVSFSTLVNDPIFQRTMGHRHILPASPFLLFRGDRWKDPKLMVPWMPLLWNVTVAQSYDQNGIINAARNKQHDLKEYTSTFEKFIPLNKRTFSVGLSGGTNFPLRDIHSPKQLEKYNFPLTLASTEKFYNSSNYIFYHTPPKFTCFHNSSIYREAPVTNITTDTFPKSSIGFGIDDRKLWMETYRDSKFCLCIRGYV